MLVLVFHLGSKTEFYSVSTAWLCEKSGPNIFARLMYFGQCLCIIPSRILEAIMATTAVFLFWLVTHSYSFPLLEENSLEPKDDGMMFAEATGKEVGMKVDAWKNDSNVNPEELGLYLEGDIVQHRSRSGLTALAAHWPGGVVPYAIGGSFSEADLMTIKKAMDEFHQKTCIRFVPRNRDADYLLILNDYTGCWSSVGRVGGAQKLNLQSPGCLTSLGTPVHELMHAVGFLHEHTRYERDNYVTINWQNIEPGRESNFQKAKKGQEYGQGVEYDYRSVMHYSAYAFSRNNQPTILPKVGRIEIGQRAGFSRGDVLKIRRMYGCSNQRPGA